MSKPGPMIVRILPDGSVKITTDAVSPAAHMRAERFLSDLANQMGGAVKRERGSHGHHHHGDHEHSHDHDGDHDHDHAHEGN